ncbi:helix-turn-helix domain-containing protein [Sporohalobacter salinus]|uniref:helix-turn-helix domain-containing protein n=1 Tax=Sporohalobacter salinus TaxID=1494606 RepID=UPI00195F9941|nr:RodZ domain-containing protein [Sporohalobacter salinus]MBM7623442.1 cytoskeletal protein RodZ [Sporohalobacter salinus]
MEEIEKLGQKIRQARLDRGITIEEVQKSTKIRRKYLQAIEEGDFNVISQEVFLKGFLRVYANYVGLDGREILNEYNQLKQLHQEPKEDETSVEIEEHQSTSEKVVCFISKHLIKIVVTVVILAVIISGGFLLYENGVVNRLIQTEQKVSNQKDDMSQGVIKANDNISQEPINTEVDVSENKQETINNKNQVEIKKKDKENSEPNITIKVIKSSWVKVVVDGEIVLEKILNSGIEKSWYAEQNIKLLTANAAGVKVIFDDKTFGPFGKQGEVVEKKFTIKKE